MTFESLGVMPSILEALETRGYTTPTPIQEKSIPFILEGRDLQGCAQTGTGKTAAFCIPIIQRLSQNPKKGNKIRTLILTPTRELALQIGESFSEYNENNNLKQLVIFGGVSQEKQVKKLKQGVDVLIATPGRLLDLMQQKFISLSHLEIFVLDEADRMLDMGFIHDIKKILKVLPEKRQSLFFSATMPDSIVQISNRILTNPKKVEVTPVSSTAETIDQFIYYVDKRNKKNLLLKVLEDEAMDSILIFTRTKRGANHIAGTLSDKGIKAEAIHGNKSQTARQRALSNFKDKKIRVLVATDIAARGIDISQLKFVINFEVSDTPETYVHRIGRSGRAGEEGVAYTFADGSELKDVKAIEKLIGKRIPEVRDHSFPMQEKESDIAKSTAKKQKQGQRGKPKGAPKKSRNNSSGGGNGSGSNNRSKARRR
ncbi:DEAD/DEAH box helicase [Flammeovirga pectinis]|uniref:DEAD-box ATP-dependent RNA helicase RhpA n=1 Tax=Flammeovirga pectinis TaxID=2494373 RepID=A0A3Q9FRV7_9BACT|nr:DEAD/DEAH box helicase [Flammeovirga pectinis]AZQ63064.1 DEAD/DEAH box helicase [Flammeovirga pectinis]